MNQQIQNKNTKAWPCEFNQYVSFIDMMKHPKWGDNGSVPETKVFEEILYEMGADLEYGYSVEVRAHRPRTDKRAITCEWVHFKERCDVVWMETGMAIEDVIRETKSEISRVGMILALNQEKKVDEIQKLQLAERVINVDVKVQQTTKQDK